MTMRGRIRDAIAAFHRDEGGQGVLFAAASMVVLIGFVALVNNVGQTTARRIRTQIGVDAMVYSGAVVQANSLSSIAWINSGMAQVYRRVMRYSVDVAATGVAAELERRQGVSGMAHTAYQEALQKARSGIPLGKQFLEDLSKIQNAIAIVTPELMWEEMYRIGQEHGLERMAVFPFQRMFPHESQESSYRIEKFADGWRITNLDSQDGEMVSMRLSRDEAGRPQWRIAHSRGDAIVREWTVTDESDLDPPRWHIARTDGPGYYVVRLGDYWVVSPDGIGVPNPGQPGADGLSIRRVRRGGATGIEITYQGARQVVRRYQGQLYRWDEFEGRWISMAQERITVGNYELSVHTDNRIRVGDMTVWVGNPPRVSVGGANMTLGNPPTIRLSVGDLTVGVNGFNPDDYHISVRGHTLTPAQADGKWRMHFSHRRRLWWRHRLTEQTPESPAAEYQWQYDYQLLGAVLRYENNIERFAVEHAIHDAWPREPDWMQWWDPERGGPRSLTDSEDGFYLTQTCRRCGGSGEIERGDETVTCPNCRGLDHSGNGRTDIRVTLGAVLRTDAGYDGIRVPRDLVYPRPFSGDTRWPLVLTEDFFRWGVTAGGWRPPSQAPMLFENEPDWGYVAIAAARVGVPRVAQGLDGEHVETLYQFDDRWAREEWVENAPENLYRADLRVRLFSTRDQIKQYDLDDDLLAGDRLYGEEQTPSSFLWHTLIHGRYSGLDEASLWFDEYNGRSDWEMSERLQRMRNRAGRALDLRSGAIDDVIRH